MKPIRDLQAEQLETRLNLSGMHLGISGHESGPILTMVASQQTPLRIISLGSENGSARSMIQARGVQEVATVKKVKVPVVKVVKTPVVKVPVVKTPKAPKTPVVKTPVVKKPSSTTTPTTVSSGPSVSGPSVSAPSSPSVAAPDPLAPILAQLYGDDVHDDSATIQALVDAANAQGITNITLPAGTFLLNTSINLYGTGITFSGQGASTILDVNNHFTGAGSMGVAINIQAKLSAPLMITQVVTGNTIIFRGQPSLEVGQLLYLSNGLGSTALVEARAGGMDTGPKAFNEDGPDEYVKIASMSTNAQGNTVVQLTENVLGTDDYFNVAPNGVTSGNYLHAAIPSTPADHLTVENLNIKFTDMGAQSAILSKLTNALTIQNVTVLNQNSLVGNGNLDLVGGTGTTVSNVTCLGNIALNSSRLATITNCTAAGVTLEEACTDNMISHNTLTGTTTCDIRVNDMACERNTFEYNTLHGGMGFSGAIAIAEGVDTTIAFNTITNGNTEIWTGLTKGTIVDGNIGGGFGDSYALNLSQVFNNSWQ